MIKHAATDSDDISKRPFHTLLVGDNQLDLLCAVSRQPGGAGVHAGRNGHLLDVGLGRVHHRGLDLVDTVNVHKLGHFSGLVSMIRLITKNNAWRVRTSFAD